MKNYLNQLERCSNKQFKVDKIELANISEIFQYVHLASENILNGIFREGSRPKSRLILTAWICALVSHDMI